MNERAKTLRPLSGTLIILINFLPVMAIASMTASMPVMLDRFSVEPDARLLVPLMVTAPALTIIVFGPLAGRLIDRVGRKRPLVLACLLYGFAGSAPLLLDDLTALVGSRLILGIGEAALITISATLIADYWDEAGRRFWLTVQGVSGPLLSSGIIAASGFLAASGWNAVFLLYLGAFPLALACFLLLPEVAPERKLRANDSKAAIRTLVPIIVPIAAVTLLASTLFYAWIVQGGLAFRAIGIESPAVQGQIFGLAHLAVIPGALLFNLTGRFMMPRAQSAFMLAVIGVGLLLIGTADSRTGMTAGLVVEQLAAGMCVMTLLSWAQNTLPSEVRGIGLGIWSACFFAGQLVSPLVFAALGGIERGVPERFALLGIGGVLAALAIGFSHLAAKACRNEAPVAADPGDRHE